MYFVHSIITTERKAKDGRIKQKLFSEKRNQQRMFNEQKCVNKKNFGVNRKVVQTGLVIVCECKIRFVGLTVTLHD